MKRILALFCARVLALGMLGCAAAEETAAPKYVFMFIGDGMGSPQVSATQYFLGTLQNPDAALPTPAELSFTTFQSVGIMTTYDASSFCPDSASTATSMASGEKTLSGVINYNIDKTEPFKIITEYAKEAGKKVGVISTVSLNHATPAAYYAKMPSRNDYYDIAVQGITGGTLDFIGGGNWNKPDGDGAQANLYDLAKENGFNVVNTNEGIRAINAQSGRTMAVVPDPNDDYAMQYEIDRLRLEEQGVDSLALSEIVQAAIANLDNENGFFLMTEGGKIDWSCHANDAMTSIYDTIALSDAVQVAIDFAAEHPDETLIIVTGDHETGGLTIGFAATAYDTHFDYLQNQKMSFVDFDKEIAKLREEKADFAKALEVIQANYGLTTAADQPLSLTQEELTRIENAFNLSMTDPDARELTANDQLLYGGYEPLSMAVSHILNNKAGIAYTSYAHTGLLLPVYATGVGAESFTGSYDNTDIFHKTMEVMGLTQE